MISIKFGNYFDKAFWSWETHWEDANGTWLNECLPQAVYEITYDYFWLFAWITKTPIKK